MKITVIRIDDRLIHGQIITKWIAEARAEQILVVDDRSAADPMLKMILGLAVPSGIHLEVLSLTEARMLIDRDPSSLRTLMIVRNPQAMLELIQAGFDAEEYEIILGNMSFDEKKTGIRHVLDYLYVNNQDVETLKALASSCAKITIKAVPEERGKDLKILEHK
ncbi:PTS system mannose/fructose/N-acetylgalactosamine-transporter subunit IIB [Holdemania filiformis]|uniref:PTS system mannose/fructose/N-acetylgalactosamine-transporter subunit IIB n=1 Tax=Holdemania filiformis TaxID=61171 RepID=UPI00242BB6CE|nr:PTS sugar transporter subunit IIB [Holdemania filiformis]